MKIKLFKLVQNELIKIFKRKSIYVLLLISIIVVIIFNYKNPDQNASIMQIGTKNIDLKGLEQSLESSKDNIERYLRQKVSLEFYKIYNKYEENSWQKYAINEERGGYGGNKIEYNHNIENNLYLIYDYELNDNTEVSAEIYEKAKGYLKQLIEALDSNNWKRFVEIKIQNLEEVKKYVQDDKTELSKVNINIEIYELRLKNNIIFANNILNSYLDEYRTNCYLMEDSEDKSTNNFNFKKYLENKEILKYAINNNITQDISQENFNVILENKIDARISLIRTFRHFDIILVIITLYISCTTVVDETNKGTIKGLLTKPHKRATIIVSKVLACIIAVLVFMIFIIITQYIVGGIIFGFDSYKLDYIDYNHNKGQIVTVNLLIYILLVGLAKIPMYAIISIFATLMSTIFNNISITLILTLIVFYFGNTVIAEWTRERTIATVTKYFITNNWDFSQYLFGQVSDVYDLSFSFSLIIYTIYLVLVLGILIKVFNKKEIKNV